MTQRPRQSQSGQTLVIAIIILGVLLSLGVAFVAIVGRNINEAGRGRDRSLATTLARAGAEFAHYQLRYSVLGADWRPEAVDPATFIDAQGFTRDPDAHYLRPRDPNFPFRTGAGNTPIEDLGGPDGLGPYSRVQFAKGRALVRVRYAPTEFNVFAQPGGQLREPGKARSYLTIEVIGRPGRLDPNDPTLVLKDAVKAANFANAQEKQSELGRLASANNLVTNSRRLLAFSSIGMLEAGRFIHNKYKVSRPAELGWPNSSEDRNQPGWNVFDSAGTGLRYGDGRAPYSNQPDDQRPLVGSLGWGRVFAEPVQGYPDWSQIPGGGSLWVNGDLRVFGTHNVALNTFLGESWSVAGTIGAANNLSQVNVSRVFYDPANNTWASRWQAVGSTVQNPVQLGPGVMDSTQVSFTTVGGAFRDGRSEPDELGYPRAVSRKEPPSVLTTDPQNNVNRFLAITRDSGRIVDGRNIGRFGLGRGVYVDSVERGNTSSEDEREISGAVKSLPTDWLNPNNPASQGWKGPFYVPLAASLRLLPDGFEIVRDSRSRRAFWRDENNRPTNSARARFRIRQITVGNRTDTYILNSIQHPGLVGQPGASLTDQQFLSSGQVFNGVVYFEGDVRVRGVIPTDNQLTVVSMGTVYVDGSVTKGVVTETGQVIDRPSRSACVLMAKDYVCLNTSMFVGPAPGESVETKQSSPIADTPSPFELRLEAPDLVLETQFLLDQESGNPNRPTTWQPLASTYQSAGTGERIATRFTVAASGDDGGPTFAGLDVFADSYGIGANWGGLLFPRNIDFGFTQVQFNAASQFFSGVGNIPVYGLGDPTRNVYPKFESIGMPLAGQFSTLNGRVLTAPAGLGGFNLALQDPSYLKVKMSGVGQAPLKNFLGARTVVAPHDVRIEAVLFAEEGSFFVIPGNWFNQNTQDTRRNWLDRSTNSLYSGLTDAQANLRRFELFGNSPETPFHGEPLDVRVTILGSVSENLPAPISQQVEWLRKWGWIPRFLGSAIGSDGQLMKIPEQHTDGFDLNAVPTVSNLNIVYDPTLATASYFDPNEPGQFKWKPVRTDENGWVLPPMPRLPVSPTLAYFGEVNP
ncbi:MAG: hypothetical protein KF884_00445 [Fimbriimonadaceae bacterium]|nr:hypothetical protein [Fimbriimonadaceae bacterium]QYK58564.1 MAG: hypothetical protein KF884_00445 [Fimbriimonadaceae bacterium]